MAKPISLQIPKFHFVSVLLAGVSKGNRKNASMFISMVLSRQYLVSWQRQEKQKEMQGLQKPAVIVIPAPAAKFQKVEAGVPDTQMTREATGLLREFSTLLLFNHSHRVFFWANEMGRQAGKKFDIELLFVSAAFHDFGLLKRFSSETDRFEVDGANAVRQFLTAHKLPEEQIETAWQAIALHTTPGVTQYMRPEVALLYSGVGLDVLGKGFDEFPAKLREEIVARFPRKNFKEEFLKDYFGGFALKPGTTYGTVNGGICERFMTGYEPPNACDLIAASPFPDSQ